MSSFADGSKKPDMPSLIGQEGLVIFSLCDLREFTNALGHCDFEVIMNFFKARTLYRMRRYFFPGRKADIQCLQQVKIALDTHSHCMLTVREDGDVCFHWIVVRHGVVYDSLMHKPCTIDNCVGTIDRVFYLELNPDISINNVN